MKIHIAPFLSNTQHDSQSLSDRLDLFVDMKNKHSFSMYIQNSRKDIWILAVTSLQQMSFFIFDICTVWKSSGFLLKIFLLWISHKLMILVGFDIHSYKIFTRKQATLLNLVENVYVYIAVYIMVNIWN